MITTTRLPRLQKRDRGIHAGRAEILLSKSQTWDDAQRFAAEVVARLGLVITEKIDGPDAWIWEVQRGNVTMVLGYDDYPCETTLGSVDAAGDDAIHAIFSLLREETWSELNPFDSRA